MSLLDINVQADTESDLDLQIWSTTLKKYRHDGSRWRPHECIFRVQNDDEDDVLCTRLHGFPISSVHVMMSAMMSRLPSGKSSV
jgi:hypothetical protein